MAFLLENFNHACRLSITNHFSAVPTGNEDTSETTTFYSNEGRTARIDCPIAPGSWIANYYVSWTSGGADPDRVFYQTSFVFSGVIQDSERYNIDPNSLSLLISNVTPGDMRFNYHCLLGVEPYLGNPSGSRIYNNAGTIALELSVSSECVGNWIFQGTTSH